MPTFFSDDDELRETLTVAAIEPDQSAMRCVLDRAPR